MHISIDAERTGRALIAAVVAFNVIAFLVQVAALVLDRDDGLLARQFDVSEEGNLTAWVSAVLLLGAAAIAAAAALEGRSRRDPDTRWWWALAAGFVYLSLDEAAALHEILIDPVGDLTGASGFFRYAWIIVAIPVVALVGLVLLGFLRRLPPSTRTGFLLGGALFIAGSIVVEALGGAAIDAGIDFFGANRMFVSVEELLENLGVAVFIATVLRHMAEVGTGSATVEIVTRTGDRTLG